MARLRETAEMTPQKEGEKSRTSGTEAVHCAQCTLREIDALLPESEGDHGLD